MGMAFTDCRVAQSRIFVPIIHCHLRQSHGGKNPKLHFYYIFYLSNNLVSLGKLSTLCHFCSQQMLFSYYVHSVFLLLVEYSGLMGKLGM